MRITKTATVTVTKEAVIPRWMELAMDDKKIDAIKELRAIAGHDPYTKEGYCRLIAAKNIVEHFMASITTL